MWKRAAPLLTATLLACGQLKDTHPPTTTNLGVARVLSAEAASAQTGESKSGRIVLGLIAGGVTGALIGASAEGDLGTANLSRYQLELPDRSTATVTSFSIVAIGDCVIVSRVGDKPERILERTDPTQCVPVP